MQALSEGASPNSVRAEMTFWEAFFRTLHWRPRQALASLYWHLTRRKVRARNGLRLVAAEAPYAYDYWIRAVEDNPGLGKRVPVILKGWSRWPKFTILLRETPGATSEQIKRTIDSVLEQFYPHWQLIVTAALSEHVGLKNRSDPRLIILPRQLLNSNSELNAAIASTSGEFLVPVRIGQFLSPAALFRFGEALQGERQPSIIYGDQDEIDDYGRRIRPWFKPQWDEEMFLAQDYVSEACAVAFEWVRRVLPIREVRDEAFTFALLLAASRAAAGPVIHVPHVLSHICGRTKRSNQAARLAVIGEYLEPIGVKAVPGRFDSVKAEWPLPDDAPAVSIIIPTRDKIELLHACVESVLTLTSYARFELLVIDNGSAEPKALSYLSRIAEHPAVRVISYDHPYNYSAINNFAVGHASAPYLCLLNNDTEVITPDWLTEMMRYAVRADVGAVGAKLLYDDGTIQHAGVIIGICDAAGHAHRFQRSEEAGYFAQPHLTHVVSAVTAACLVVEKSKYESVGGLDADHLAIAYNDVDLCLKLERAGWRNIYVPHAVLLHHESKSRGQDMSPKNINRYRRELAVLQERWGTKTYQDPRHNQNLDRNSENFVLKL
jgi:O-antigen biosynthesis protein